MRRMRDRRHKRRNLLLVSAETLGWGVGQTVRGLFFGAFRRSSPVVAAKVPISRAMMGTDGVPVRS